MRWNWSIKSQRVNRRGRWVQISKLELYERENEGRRLRAGCVLGCFFVSAEMGRGQLVRKVEQWDFSPSALQFCSHVTEQCASQQFLWGRSLGRNKDWIQGFHSEAHVHPRKIEKIKSSSGANYRPRLLTPSLVEQLLHTPHSPLLPPESTLPETNSSKKKKSFLFLVTVGWQTGLCTF